MKLSDSGRNNLRVMNPVSISTLEEADSAGKSPSVILTEVIKVVRNLLCDRAPGQDEIHPEMLRTLDLALQCHMEDRGKTCGLAGKSVGSTF